MSSGADHHRPAFTGDRILGAILFEQTMEREVAGTATPLYLWQRKQVVPFVKVDEGLADETDGVRLMKPFTKLDDAARAGHPPAACSAPRCARSSARPTRRVSPPCSISSSATPSRSSTPASCRSSSPRSTSTAARRRRPRSCCGRASSTASSALPDGRQVMLKLSIPTQDGFYAELIEHPKVLRVVALSGGYSRDEADARLARNHGLIASFSRALTEGLRRQQTDDEFNQALDTSIAAHLPLLDHMRDRDRPA